MMAGQSETYYMSVNFHILRISDGILGVIHFGLRLEHLSITSDLRRGKLNSRFLSFSVIYTWQSDYLAAMQLSRLTAH